MGPSNPALAFLLAALCAAPLSAQDQTPETLAKAVPGFGQALIALSGKPQPPATADQHKLLDATYAAAALPPGFSADDLARAYLVRAASSPQSLEQACRYLETLGPDGQAAAERLRAAPAPAAPVRAAAAGQTAAAVGRGQWDEAGSRRAFDNALPGNGSVVAAPQSPASRPSGLSPNLPDVLTKPPPPGTIKIVSVGWEKLQDIAREQVYQERKEDFNKAFGIRPDESIGGGGAFTVKILDPGEVAADPVKQAVRDDGLKKGEKIVFVRTNTKVQLFGNQGIPIPIDIPVGGLDVSAGVGLSLGGIVEIVETRAVPESRAGALAHAEKRVFLWPLTAEHLKTVMRVGEDLTITGRLQAGASASLGAGAGLGLSAFARVGENAGAGVGGAADRWVTLHIKKIDPDHVRILVQLGDDETVSANVSAFAGLDLHADTLIPEITPSKVEEGLLGKAVIGGEKSVLKQVQDLASASLSQSWGAAKNDVAAEGWASVPLSDPKAAAALDAFFKFKPEALRNLPADETFSKALKAGRLMADVRDVTHNEAFQAHLSKLKVSVSDQSSFYELRWREDDGKMRHYLVGIGDSRAHGDVTKTNHAEETVMWYDLDSEKAAVTVSLGPEDRLFTTTREKINDVIATQKAMGAPVQGWVREPSPYLQLFGLGNYGRSEEKGTFYLSPEGVSAVDAARRERLTAAYLRADWLYEKESWPPGTHFWNAAKPPPWSETADPKALAPVLDFLHRHAADVRRLQGDKDDRGELSSLEADYAKVAPGRFLREDAWRYSSASEYANKVGDMQQSGGPEAMVELFLKLRKDSQVDLKRAVMATAEVAGEGRWQGWIQMTGTRVELKPAGAPPALPPHPVSRLNSELASWQ